MNEQQLNFLRKVLRETRWALATQSVDSYLEVEVKQVQFPETKQIATVRYVK